MQKDFIAVKMESGRGGPDMPDYLDIEAENLKDALLSYFSDQECVDADYLEEVEENIDEEKIEMSAGIAVIDEECEVLFYEKDVKDDEEIAKLRANFLLSFFDPENYVEVLEKDRTKYGFYCSIC